MNVISLVMQIFAPFRAALSRRSEAGASLVEYALLLALIAVASLVALHFLGGAVSNTLQDTGNQISNYTTTTV